MNFSDFLLIIVVLTNWYANDVRDTKIVNAQPIFIDHKEYRCYPRGVVPNGDN